MPTRVVITTGETNKSTLEEISSESGKTNTVKPKAVKKLTAKNRKKKCISLKWKKVSKSTGYEIQYALDKKYKKSKKIKSTLKLSYTLKKLKKNKTYYVRVRAYVISDGKKVTGSWSKTKKVKIKK